ncbi:TetR/AcrR family transcriptional regulator [Streptomyces sp. NPDC050535]|uniref:TetR/AcrR family transcriptional regulator n=1 Tax=Streptomyces sp. NPDC050535 TaxID=3365626 RepID=UPI00378E855B
MEQSRRRATRSDARDNRERIIETARRVLTENPRATLQSIARAANVGQGTMYRHFSCREALLLAVYREDIEVLIDAVPQLLKEQPPLEALRLWFDRLAAYGRIKHGACLAVEAATRADQGTQYYAPVFAALDRLLTAGKEAQQVRADADVDEVLLLVSFLWRADSGPDWHKRSQHMLTIVIDGLRADTHRR